MAIFDLDTKIELNRKRLDKDLQEIKNIQNSYPLFFAYLAFIGLYFTDFFKYLRNYNPDKLNDVFIFLFTILTTVFLLFSIGKFIQMLFPQKIYYDKQPKEVYTGYMELLSKFYEEDKLTSDEC